MAVAHLQREGLGALDLPFEVLDEDIVVAGGLHLGEFQDLFRPAHMVDVDELRVLLAEAGRDDVRGRHRRVERCEARDVQEQRLPAEGDVVVHRVIHQRARVDEEADLPLFHEFEDLITVLFADVRPEVFDIGAEVGNVFRRLGCRVEFEPEVVEFLRKGDGLQVVVFVDREEDTDVP